MNQPATEILKSFRKSLQKDEDIFTPEMVKNLATLQTQIKQLTSPSNEDLAKIILAWVQPYDNLKAAMLANRDIINDEDEDEDEENTFTDGRKEAEKVDNITLLDITIEDYKNQYLSNLGENQE